MPLVSRPLPLTRPPSTTRGILPAAEAPATPTGLQRQATSLYSNFSTGSGPLLVYGKTATPLAGDWSAEPWSPAGLAGAAEDTAAAVDGQELHESGFMLTSVPLEAVDRMDTEDSDPTFDDFSSAAETAAFIADEPAPVVPSSTPSPPGQTPEENAVPAPTTTEPPLQDEAHCSLIYRHDPYVMCGRRELFRCFCDDCMNQAMVATNTPQNYLPYEHTGGMVDANYGSAQGFGSNTEEYQHQPQQQAEGGPWGETASVLAPEPQQAPPATVFMPPPPPPRITRRVLGESAEENLDVDAAFYYVSMRWYSKLEQVQHNFVPKDEPCPAPGSPDQTFLEWVDEVGRWWLRHFEHRQTKVSSSSVLLRSSYTVAQARSSGFATHVPTAARREVPRRQVGSSGLNADMLAQLNGPVALPTPRSLEKRRCEGLPW